MCKCSSDCSHGMPHQRKKQTPCFLPTAPYCFHPAQGADPVLNRRVRHEHVAQKRSFALERIREPKVRGGVIRGAERRFVRGNFLQGAREPFGIARKERTRGVREE